MCLLSTHELAPQLLEDGLGRGDLGPQLGGQVAGPRRPAAARGVEAPAELEVPGHDPAADQSEASAGAAGPITAHLDTGELVEPRLLETAGAAASVRSAATRLWPATMASSPWTAATCHSLVLELRCDPEHGVIEH